MAFTRSGLWAESLGPGASALGNRFGSFLSQKLFPNAQANAFDKKIEMVNKSLSRQGLKLSPEGVQALQFQALGIPMPKTDFAEQMQRQMLGMTPQGQQILQNMPQQSTSFVQPIDDSTSGGPSQLPRSTSQRTGVGNIIQDYKNTQDGIDPNQVALPAKSLIVKGSDGKTYKLDSEKDMQPGDVFLGYE